MKEQGLGELSAARTSSLRRAVAAAAVLLGLGMSAPAAAAGAPAPQSAGGAAPPQARTLEAAPPERPGPAAVTTPTEVTGLLVGYAAGVAPTRHGQVTGAEAVPHVDLVPGRSPGAGVHTVRFPEPLSPAGAAEVARRLADSPLVEWAEPDHALAVPEPAPAGRLTVSAVQSGPPWGLDRIDQRSGTDGHYRYTSTGAGVTAYVVDSGIRPTHTDLTGRVAPGFTAVADGNGTADCNGHGTHVAGIVGGTRTGVAKDVTLVPVRIMDCAGEGTTSMAIAGLTWIAEHHTPGSPAVANLSFGGQPSAALDQAVHRLVRAGITVVVAAGNEGVPACEVSPGRVPEVLTVGATTAEDAATAFTNDGTCVDIHAPGEAVPSTGHADDAAVLPGSGTSMAAPHVTGAAARILQATPDRTPAQVAQAIDAWATPVDIAPPGSPDKLLHIPPGAGAPVEPRSAAATLPDLPARLAGWDRYATSTAISRAAYTRPAPVVYVADGRSVVDALAGAPVAARHGAPLLLVTTDGVPPPVAAELAELAPREVVVLGGPAAVSEATVAELGRLTGADVRRTAGPTRYETAATISRQAHEPGAPVVYVAGGAGAADALAAAPVAGRTDAPVLLVHRGTVPDAVAEELRRLAPEEVVVVGGPSVVSDATLTELRAITGAPVSRLAGPDRYTTATRITAASYTPGAPVLYVANGTRFADALTGAAVAGRDEAPLLLVRSATVPAEVAAEIERLAPERVVLLGGPAVVAESVAQQLLGP